MVRALADDKHLENLRVEDISSSEAQTVSPNEPLEEAAEEMRRHSVPRLPVVERGRTVRILSIGDLAIERGDGSALADIGAAWPNRDERGALCHGLDGATDDTAAPLVVPGRDKRASATKPLGRRGVTRGLVFGWHPAIGQAMQFYRPGTSPKRWSARNFDVNARDVATTCHLRS